MKCISTLFLSFFVLMNGLLAQGNYVVPTAYSTTNSTGTFLGPLTNSARTYQLLIAENQLTGLAGKQLTGFTFRRTALATGTWPPADAVYTNYDVYLSGSVAPAQRSLTFANNIVGTQTQVRTGSLTIPAGAYGPGGSPNAFGPVISFTTPYTYTSGNLLVEIRHDGSSSTSNSVEAVLTSGAGYGTNFSSCWTGNYAGVSGVQGNFAVVQFTYQEPLPLVLTAFTAKRRVNDGLLQWTTASENNTSHFEVERSADGTKFERVTNLPAAGQSTSSKSYQFTDANITRLNTAIVYYRLKMVDKDGLFTYSKIETINISRKEAIVSLYPNPATDRAFISINTTEKETVQYSITSVEGRVLQTGIYACVQGQNIFSINVSALAGGNYYLLLKGTNTQQVVPLNKQ